MAALTALQRRRDKRKIQPGQKVLINGAAGGVGTFAVQIAKSFGADVTGVCSTRNVNMVRSFGADRVIDYNPVRPLDRLIRALVMSCFSRNIVAFVAKASTEDLTVLHELREAGKVTAVIDKRYRLSEAAEAIRYLEEGHARGKVVITLE